MTNQKLQAQQSPAEGAKQKKKESPPSSSLSPPYLVAGTVVLALAGAYTFLKAGNTVYLSSVSTPGVINDDITAGKHLCSNGLLWKTDTQKHPIIPYEYGPEWGTFQPGLYMGMKSKSLPHALSTAIMWTQHVFDGSGIRYSTQEEVKFDWLMHDGERYGVQRILDENKKVKIDASFVIPQKNADIIAEVDSDALGDEDAELLPTWLQSFNIQFDNEKRTSSFDGSNYAFFFSFGLECTTASMLEQCIEASGLRDLQVHHHSVGIAESQSERVSVSGFSRNSGHFRLDIIPRVKKTDSLLNMVHYIGFNASDSAGAVGRLQKEADRMSAVMKSKKKQKRSSAVFNRLGELTNKIQQHANSIIFQISCNESTTVDIELYEHLNLTISRNTESAFVGSADESISQREALFQKYSDKFNKKWGDVYASSSLNYNDDRDADSYKAVAKTALSSLLGGMGYFAGSPLVGIAAVDDSSLASTNSVGGDSGSAVFSSSSSSGKCPDHDRSTTNRGSMIGLFSASPSRTVFPRGFLWDEGFHQMVISKWNVHLSLQSLATWLNAMHFPVHKQACEYVMGNNCAGGWIPREMILGDSGESRVPAEFVIQRPDIANPPTLLLVLEDLLEEYGSLAEKTQQCRSSSDNNDGNRATDGSCAEHTGNREALMKFLSSGFDRLHTWVQWYLSSQSGSSSRPNTFRWRGRSKHDGKVIPNTLSSGLDDYPRSVEPSAEEIHVDLLSWMAAAARIMNRIQNELAWYTGSDPQSTAVVLPPRTGAYDYASAYELFKKSLVEFHWSEELKGFFDVGLNNEKSYFVKEVFYRCSNPKDNSGVDILMPIEPLQRGESPAKYCPKTHPKPMYPMGDGSGGLLMKEKLVPVDLRREYIPRVGYVNLFPLLVRAIDPKDERRISAVLDMIEDPVLLWTPHGLRSIAANDTYYMRWNSGGDAPYWR